MDLTPEQRELPTALCAPPGTWGSQSHHRARIMASLTAAGNHTETSEDPAWT
jgi:hypothetical protein